MTIEQARAILEDENEHCILPPYDALDREQKQHFLKGLLLLSKYDEDIYPTFRYKVCWATDFSIVEQMTEEEVRQMYNWGWHERAYTEDTRDGSGWAF